MKQDGARLNKKVKMVLVAVIGKQTYRTAEKAAAAWALWFMARMHARKTKALGHAAYHDSVWYNRTRHFEEKAHRRALKIFQQFLP